MSDMTSQPVSSAKVSAARPIQICSKPASVSKKMPIQLLNQNQTVSFPMRTSGGAIVSDLSSNLLIQMATSTSGVPVNMTTTNSVNVSKSSSSTSNNFSSPGLLKTAHIANIGTKASLIQIIPNQQNTVKQMHVTSEKTEVVTYNPARKTINSILQKQDQSNNVSLQEKVQDTAPLGQLTLSTGQYQVPKSSSGPSIIQLSQNNALQVRVNGRRTIAPVVLLPSYVNTSSDGKLILSRQPPSLGISLPTGRQLVNIPNKPISAPSMTATTTKSPVLVPKTPHPLVIQTSKFQPKIVPVSAPLSINPKSSFSAYINSARLLPVSQDGQPSVSAIDSRIPISSANQKSQKLVMDLKKMPNTVMNFQIENGQITNDSHGKVTVMGNINTLNKSDVPPLQPFSRSVTVSNDTLVTSTNLSQRNNVMMDSKFTSSISGTRVEPISKDEYSISIAETDASINDDVYTVSISENNDVNSSIEKSFTIPIPEKGKSLLSKTIGLDNFTNHCLNSSSSSQLPAILRRSNADSHDKKTNIIRKRMSTEKSDNNLKIDLKRVDSFSSKENSSISKGPSKISSLFCDEELDADLDIKPVSAPIFNHINKDRRKSRVSSEVHLDNVSEKEGENSLFFNKIDRGQSLLKQNDKSFIDNPLDDTPGLHWTNGTAVLNGSNIQLQLNEFGIIDVIEENALTKKKNIAHDFFDHNGRNKKPRSPEDFYCCKECGCHGLAAEFLNKNFCSFSCSQIFQKTSRYKKSRQLVESKKKKRLRKLIVQKQGEKEVPDATLNDEDSRDMQFEIKKKEEPKVFGNKQLISNKNFVNSNKDSSQSRPWLCPKSGFSWMKYLEHTKATAAPAKFFKEFSPKNGFKLEMKLEAIDPVHPSLFSVVTIKDIQGHRLRLHFDGYPEDYDFWVNSDSCDIYPPGWCEKTKRKLRLPVGYEENNFSWPLYIRHHKAVAAPKALFPHLSSNSFPTGFRIGMKLEAEDKKNSLTCVATCADIINNKILIHFDSWDDIYDYWVDPTSPYIHPVGWCDENGYSLTPPNTFVDPENFTWEQYLMKTESLPVPARAFKPRQPHKFEVGMKLEAVDKRVPFLIRVATITGVENYQIRISFDGWPDELSYWVDDDCSDIHQPGWCLKTGHLLEPPLTTEDLKNNSECGTPGCHGLGNSQSAKLSTHHTASECPYRLPAVSPIQRDRLDGVRPPPQLSEPRPREPRKLSNMKQKDIDLNRNVEPANEDSFERVPKKKVADEIKVEIMSDEDSCSPPKIMRSASPINKEQLEYSVYEPGYLPNPNRLAPVNSKCNYFPLKEILEKESLNIDPRNWNQSNVQRFVQHILCCSDYSWKFSKHRIDGESFLMLAQEDLVSIIGMKLGPAIKVYNAIVQLRQNVLS